MRKPNITIRKYMGDDCYSWALFRDGRVVCTGMSRSSAQFERECLKRQLAIEAANPDRLPIRITTTPRSPA